MTFFQWGTWTKTYSFKPSILEVLHMEVSINGGTPKSSIFMGFSIINHHFLGTPSIGNPQIYIYIYLGKKGLSCSTIDFHSACWFGTWILFFQKYGISNHLNWRNHIFSEGWRETTKLRRQKQYWVRGTSRRLLEDLAKACRAAQWSVESGSSDAVCFFFKCTLRNSV